MDFSGSLLWTHQLTANEFPTSIVVSTGAIYVSGRFQLLPSKSFIRRYDAAGNEMWTAELPAGSINRIAASATGIYAAGTTNYTLPGQCAAGSSDVYVKGYDPNGQDLGTHQFGSYDVDMANQIAIDNESIHVSGTRTRNEYYPISSRVFLAKLVADLHRL